MAWDYAELSKAAKKAGGPEKLMELITEAGKQKGRSEMLPLLGVAVVAGYAISKLVDFFRRKKITPEEVEAAKAEIIQGIKDYDSSHPEELTETGNCGESMPNQDGDETDTTGKLKEDE